ncbi:MAG: hypothetical protein R3F39_08025 [Myxococcota bacterium]
MGARLSASLAWLAAGALALGSACDLPLPNSQSNFVDSAFGDVEAEVLELDGAALGPVMTELFLRFRSYIALREVLSFADLDDEDACISQLDGTVDDFRFIVDLACRFGAVASASGQVDVRQRQIDSDPVPVFRVDAIYLNSHVGAVRVDGTEQIVETGTDDGGSVRTLALTQNGFAFDYTFRLGQLDPETPVFDYAFDIGGVSGQGVSVRLTNPATVGAFATVLVTGVDGVLRCEIRDAAWEPGDPARGTCDNGATFGL